MRKPVKDVLAGNSGVFSAQVLPVTKEVIGHAENFIRYAFKYKFASLDAMIAGTVISYGKSDMIVVTHDSSFRNALTEEGILTMPEGERILV